jgi:hypothetical protein
MNRGPPSYKLKPAASILVSYVARPFQANYVQPRSNRARHEAVNPAKAPSPLVLTERHFTAIVAAGPVCPAMLTTTGT